MTFKENGFKKKFDMLEEKFLDALNTTAEEHFAAYTLHGTGIRVLAEMFNRDVVEKQISRSSTQENPDRRIRKNGFVVSTREEGVDIVPFQRVTPLQMERHYLDCIKHPLVKVYKLAVKLERDLEEMDKNKIVIYEHKNTETSGQGKAVRYNYPAQANYLNTTKVYVAVLKNLNEMKSKHRGYIYRKPPKDSMRRK